MVDKIAIMQVLGCLMKNPFLFMEVDKYKFNVIDFEPSLARQAFMAISNLASKGVQNINVIDVTNILCSNKSFLIAAESDEEKVIEYINQCLEIAEVANFDFYYEIIKKYSALRQLSKKYDISYFYCDDILNKDYQKIKDRFDESSVEDIFDYYKGELYKLENDFVTHNKNDGGSAVDGMIELKESLKKSPAFGDAIQGNILNSVLMGARRGKYYVLSAPTGGGKAIPNYTKIPTPFGFKLVEEIKPGDYLIGQNGYPTKVLQVYPQKTKKKIYKIYFNDGRIAECCEDHLWEVFEKKELKVLNTKQILKDLSRKEIFVRMNQEIIFELEKDNNLKNKKTIGTILTDKELDNEEPLIFLKDFLFYPLESKILLMEGILNNRNVLFGKIFLKETLRAKKEDLGDFFRSLGIKTIEIPSGVLVCPTAEQIEKYFYNFSGLTESEPFVQILNIEETNNYTDMTCFTVEAEDHLFLMNNFIVTHNTRLMVGHACNLAYPIYWENGNWYNSENNNKILFITTELDKSEIQTQIIAHLSGVNEEKILYGTYTKEEEERVDETIKLLENYKNNFFIEQISDPTIRSVETLIRKYKSQEDIDAFFYDYIFTSPSLLNDFKASKIREDKH